MFCVTLGIILNKYWGARSKAQQIKHDWSTRTQTEVKMPANREAYRLTPRKSNAKRSRCNNRMHYTLLQVWASRVFCSSSVDLRSCVHCSHWARHHGIIWHNQSIIRHNQSIIWHNQKHNLSIIKSIIWMAGEHNLPRAESHLNSYNVLHCTPSTSCIPKQA